MKLLKKSMAVLLTLLILMVAAFPVAAAETESNQVYGKIISKSGHKITVLVGNMDTLTTGSFGGGGEAPGGNPPGMPGGLPGSKPDAHTGATESDSSEKKDATSGASETPKMEQTELTVFVAGTDTAKYWTLSKDLTDYSVGDVVCVTSSGLKRITAIEKVEAEVTTATADQGTAATTIKDNTSFSDKTYESTKSNENALRVDGAVVDLKNITVNKKAGETTDPGNGDFYGINAGVLATNGATVTLSGAKVTTNAQGGNGVFSYGSGTTVNISDSTIVTKKDNSGGIQTTGGGTTNATNLKVTTNGNSSAAIRSDRGGGFVTVNGGTYTSKGYNSPAIYSTARIKANNATLTAENSEALVIEGKNSISLKNTNVTGNMSKTKSSAKDINVHNVMIYQSMSGDAELGTAAFSMTGGSITGNSGDLFYLTNTDAKVTLENVKLVNNDKNGNLFTVTGNNASHGWGTAGKNGANVTLVCKDQDLNGSIVVDSISTLKMTLSDGSDFVGTVNVVDNAEGGFAVDNNAVVTIEEGSTWKLTGNCTITSLNNKGTIDFNGYTITLADGTVLSE